MVKEYNKNQMENNNIIEFITTFTTINEKKSFAFISIPFQAVKKAKFNKQTKLKITLEEIKEDENIHT
jgi:hypothetical protein